MRRASLALLIALVLSTVSILTIITPQTGVDAVGDPEITIALAQTKQTAYVAPGQDGIVTFTGTVFVQVPWSPNIQYLVVDLTADAGDWPVSVPPSLTFSKAVKQQSFVISVQVPIGTSSGDTYGLTVGGYWHYEPGMTGGECEPATALIFVKQYYDLDLSSENPFLEALVDEKVETTVLVDNKGNGKDEIQLSIANADELLEAGIQALFSEELVDVGFNETAEVGLFIKVDRYTAHQSYEIEIEGWSYQAVSMGELCKIDTLMIFLDVVIEKSYVEPEPEPEPEPDDDDTEPEPEPEPEPDDDDIEPDNGPGSDDDVPGDEDNELTEEEEQTDAGEENGSSILIPLIVIGIILLFVIVPGAIYFLVRRSGGRKVEAIE
ncbi:MAG: choice-of-anchor T family protein [Thermoplasmatota archaeon]